MNMNTITALSVPWLDLVGCKAAGSWSWSLKSSSEVKNAWSYTSTSHVFTTWCL